MLLNTKFLFLQVNLCYIIKNQNSVNVALL